MSTDEQDRIVAAMVNERRELRKTIACLKQKLTWVNRDLNEAVKFARLALEGTVTGRESGITYLSADELVDTLESLRNAKARLAEITERLDAC